MKLRHLAALLLGLSTACDEGGSTSSTGSTSTAPPGPSSGPTGKPGPGYPTGTAPAVREVVVRGAQSGGLVAEGRLHVSRITPADPLVVSMRLLAPGEGGLVPRAVRWEDELTDVKAVVKAAGKPDQTLPVAPPRAQVDVFSFVLGGAAPSPWPEPGAYRVVLQATLALGGGKTQLTLPEIAFEVAPAGDSYRSLADLSARAAAFVAEREGAKQPPRGLDPAIDDVDNNRWFRFGLHDDNEHYDLRVVEVLLSPAGEVRTAHAYSHFTCIAEGIAIATPEGPVPVERLGVGRVVWGYDVEAGRRVETAVEAIQPVHARALYAIDGLRVTGEHPIFAGGRWVPARDVTPGVLLRGLDGVLHPATVATRLGDESTAYELSVAWPHTYFAAEVLVHNKAAHVPLGGKLPWRGLFHYKPPAGKR